MLITNKYKVNKVILPTIVLLKFSLIEKIFKYLTYQLISLKNQLIPYKYTGHLKKKVPMLYLLTLYIA